MGVHWGSLPQGALARTKGEVGGVRAGALELDEEGCESRRARGSIRHAWALVVERDRGQSLKERRPQPPSLVREIPISAAAEVATWRRLPTR